MTDRINMLFVALEIDMREDDVQALVNAIKMIRGVLTVAPNVADPVSRLAEERAKLALRLRLKLIDDYKQSKM